MERGRAQSPRKACQASAALGIYLTAPSPPPLGYPYGPQIRRVGAVAVAKALAPKASLELLALDENMMSEDGRKSFAGRGARAGCCSPACACCPLSKSKRPCMPRSPYPLSPHFYELDVRLPPNPAPLTRFPCVSRVPPLPPCC